MNQLNQLEGRRARRDVVECQPDLFLRENKDVPVLIYHPGFAQLAVLGLITIDPHWIIGRR